LLRCFHNHAVLPRVSSLVAHHLVLHSDFRPSRNVSRVLDRLIIVVLRRWVAAKNDVAGKGAADLHVEGLLGVVPQPLGKQRTVVSTDDRAIDFDPHARLGVDLDPVAWFVVKNELTCTDPAEVRMFFDQIGRKSDRSYSLST
jgi:hypothetical protein